jgi:hypothetical protein
VQCFYFFFFHGFFFLRDGNGCLALHLPLTVGTTIQHANAWACLVEISQLGRCCAAKGANHGAAGGVVGDAWGVAVGGALANDAVIKEASLLSEGHVEVGRRVPGDVTDVGRGNDAAVLITVLVLEEEVGHFFFSKRLFTRSFFFFFKRMGFDVSEGPFF